MAFSIATYSIMTFSKTEENVRLDRITLIIIQYHYAECLFTLSVTTKFIMLSVAIKSIMLSVSIKSIMPLCVIMLSVVML
jgi:hypothetical protein